MTLSCQMILLIALVLTVTTTAILTVWVNCMGALCTACQKLTRLVFQSERNAMFLLCLAGMITLRNHTKNLAKHIFFGADITSLAQELFMSSWKSPERGSNILRIKCWRMEKLYVQMHWHQSLLMVISNVSGKKSRNTTPATWLTVTE